MMNGNGGTPQTAINPMEAARFALLFLSRADFKSGERQMFDIAEALLKAIAEGHVSIASNQPNDPPQPLPPPKDEVLQ